MPWGAESTLVELTLGTAIAASASVPWGAELTLVELTLGTAIAASASGPWGAELTLHLTSPISSCPILFSIDSTYVDVTAKGSSALMCLPCTSPSLSVDLTLCPFSSLPS